jgi:methionyl-tRNA formyltransferase
MRIIWAGSAWFGQACLERVLGSRHQVVGILVPTLKDGLVSRVGWGRVGLRAAGIRRISLERESAAREAVLQTKADLLVSCGFPVRIPEKVFTGARLGGMNIHPSLLPKYRGPDPCFAAVLAGDTESGVSFHAMTVQFDAGGLLQQFPFPLGPGMTRGDVVALAANVAATRVVEVLDGLAEGTLEPRAQDERLASRCRPLSRVSARIDWSRPAEETMRQYRAHTPGHPLWFEYLGRPIHVLDLASHDCGDVGQSGNVLDAERPVLVATGGGRLEIRLAVRLRPFPCLWPMGWDKVRAGTVLS